MLGGNEEKRKKGRIGQIKDILSKSWATLLRRKKMDFKALE